MNRWELFDLYVYPELEAMREKYSASSMFIMGSFLQEKMWKIGLSDIDVVILSKGNDFYKGEIDLSQKCVEYVAKQMNSNFEEADFDLRISYVVWNEEWFFRQDAWEHYLKENREKESTIIEDQLIFSASSKLIIGEEKRSIMIDPIKYRTYLAARYNYAELPDRPYITLLSEVKKIIYMCRLFHYFWTGNYVYRTDQLLEESKTTFSPELVYKLEQAIDARERMSNNLVELMGMKNNYFRETKKFNKMQNEVLDELLDLDKKHSSVDINGNFVKLLFW